LSVKRCGGPLLSSYPTTAVKTGGAFGGVQGKKKVCEKSI